ncbi:MAG TPA: DUF502 domain-containing protein [bacterium]|nr:DUF502 domain-containing protein [bacterium]
MEKLRGYFWAGLLFIIPVSFSLWILVRLVIFLDGLLGGILRRFFPEVYLPGLGFVSLILLILLLGFLAQNFVGRRILRLVERLLESIPLVNKIYSFSRTVVFAVSRPESRSFKSVVKLRAFGDGYMVGFVTGEIKGTDGKRWLSVLIPTVPNPTSGFYLIVPEEEAEKLPLTIEEGFALVVSMGLVAPEQWHL